MGLPQQYFLNGREEEAEDHIKEMMNIFGEDYYLEVQWSKIPEQIKVNEFFKKMSDKLGVKVVITSDAHYVKKEDSKYHQALVAINTGGKIKEKIANKKLKEGEDLDSSGLFYTPEEYYIKSGEDMWNTGHFDAFPNAFKISNEIAEQCNVDFEIGNKYIPCPIKDINEDEYLRDLCEEKLNKYFDLNDINDAILKKQYRDRLKYELNIITKAEFSKYFLVVREYVQWAKSNDILVGPARGSAAGSLVVFLLNITNIDPLKYDLLFER